MSNHETINMNGNHVNVEIFCRDSVGMIDCHCHLADPEFDKDIENVIENARKSGIVGCLVVAVDYMQFEKVIQLCRRYPDILLPCLGVHPVQGALTGEQRCVSRDDVEKALPIMEKYASELAAVGEIGLDFQPRICKDPADKDVQKEVLRLQVDFALKHGLPVNVHSRSAGRPTISALKEFGAKNVLLHAFDGNPKSAAPGIEEGYFFSIPPSIVRSDQKKTLVGKLPVENILLESDSPALGPEKQARNEPANIKIGCEYVAALKSVDISELQKITTQNALKLFPKLTRIIK